MTIIPYVNRGMLESNSRFHFKSIYDAAYWAFKKTMDGDVTKDALLYRFRIIDSEEDILMAFTKVDEYSVNWSFNLCGFLGYIENAELGENKAAEDDL